MPVETYSAEERGVENTDTYQVFVKDAFGPISPFHDIPLVANSEANTFHIVVEIPRWTNAKMEIDTKSPLHPIVQVQFLANMVSNGHCRSFYFILYDK